MIAENNIIIDMKLPESSLHIYLPIVIAYLGIDQKGSTKENRGCNLTTLHIALISLQWDKQIALQRRRMWEKWLWHRNL